MSFFVCFVCFYKSVPERDKDWMLYSIGMQVCIILYIYRQRDRQTDRQCTLSHNDKDLTFQAQVGLFLQTIPQRERENSELYYTRIKIVGSCLFLQSVPANLHERQTDRQTNR